MSKACCCRLTTYGSLGHGSEAESSGTIGSILRTVEALVEAGAQSLLESCLLSEHLSGAAGCACLASDVAALAHCMFAGTIFSGSTLDDFLQLVPNGDRRCLTLLVMIDKMVDKVKDIPERVKRLKAAARRRHLLLPPFALGDEDASWKQEALASVVHAEVSLLDEHVRSCRDCTLLHRWRSWALSFLFLLPNERALHSIEPSALVSHALLAMLGDDSLDYAKDVAESTGTLFTHLLAKGEEGAGAAGGAGTDSSAVEDIASAGAGEHAAAGAALSVSPRVRRIVGFLGGLLTYVSRVVASIKPGTPELAPGETSPGVAAAAALPAQLAAALGRPEVADGGVNAVALRGLLRLAIVCVHRANDAGGRPAAELAWRTWFSSDSAASPLRMAEHSHAGALHAATTAAADAAASAAKASPDAAADAAATAIAAPLTDAESAQVDTVLLLSEALLADADAAAMRGCMTEPSISTDMSVLRVLLTVPDEELGENPSAMTLLWTAALLPPEDEDEDAAEAVDASAAATAAAAAP